MDEQGQAPLRVLFLCTRNAARSQIAEALLSRKGRGRFVVGSAGTNPASEVHPFAIDALREHGIDWTDATTSGIDEVRHRAWDLIITVCNRAQENCPTFAGKPAFAHWGMDDPAEAGDEAQQRAAFRQTVLYLSRRIDLLLSLPFEGLVARAAELALPPPPEPIEGEFGLVPRPHKHETPMRYALLSDIHANLPALEAVMQHIAGQEGLAGVFHLGDLVGYAPWPNETVTLLRSFRVQGIAGNYDSTVATDYKHCGCKYEDPRQEELAHESYEWTRAHVSPETRRFLGSLPFRLDLRPRGGHQPGPTVILIHGAPTLNTLYWTEDRPDSFCLKMAEQAGAKRGDVVCFGHTHKAWYREVEGIHFVNTGSVGRPKDGDWRAGYVVLDMAGERPQVEFVRVEYDLERAMAGIRDSSLPDDFAAYLRTGGKPAAAPV